MPKPDSVDRLLIAELRQRAAQLQLAALREEAFAHALSGPSASARRHRKKAVNADLAFRYQHLADELDKEWEKYLNADAGSEA